MLYGINTHNEKI